MAKREILAGAADQTIDVFIQDSSSTVGAGLTGLVFNTASLVCYYRKGATGTPTALTLATQTVGGAHSDGGFVAVDGTNCPGQYRLDLSDTIVASAGMVTVYLRGAANMVPCVSEIEVVSVNKFDAVRMGMTALPNAAAEAAGGLYTRGSGAGQINQNENGQVDTRTVGMAAATITAAAIATDAIDADALAADAVTEITAGVFARAFPATYGSLTFDQVCKVAIAVLSGKLSGAATTTVSIRNLNDSADVVVATVDADGNRSAVTITP